MGVPDRAFSRENGDILGLQAVGTGVYQEYDTNGSRVSQQEEVFGRSVGVLAVEDGGVQND